MIRQVWVRNGLKQGGPFTSSQIRQFARDGKLKPHHLLSEDRERWVPARQILTFTQERIQAK